MKNFTSVKTRITIWYTGIMLILITAVLVSVGTLSYRMSIDNTEKNVTARVSQIANKLNSMDKDVFGTVDNNEEFKNVSVYTENGKYISGQYNYDIAKIKFKDGILRRENIDGKEYIIYDVQTKQFGRPDRSNGHGGFWIRGAESVNSVILLGQSAFSVILVIIPLILLLAALGGYYITKKAFLPINNIIKTANDICIQGDISQRIEINPQLKPDELYNLSVTLNQMLDKIEKLIKQEKQFTSDASHELRTPISVILAQGEYLLDIAENKKEKELAENIVTKANQLKKLVSRLLLLARIDQNRQKFNKERVDLGVLIDIAANNMKEIAAKKDIIILTNASDSILIYADEALLLSVLTNLISNGIKYGKPHGNVIISAAKLANSAEITITDNGIGIAPEHIDKIWGRFYRVDNARSNENGSNGLGLSMVKSIVELHGGKIFVKSVPNEGTEFRIVLYD